ncbi:TPA: hypothetical protein EYP38_02965 [Candidatus Micrarchaeota archaeon]|nr:hypothetical protein [Candidatus Micrarchaeota archaeon]
MRNPEARDPMRAELIDATARGERIRQMIEEGNTSRIDANLQQFLDVNQISRVMETLEGTRSGRDAEARLRDPDGGVSEGYGNNVLQETTARLMGEDVSALTPPERAAGTVALNDLGIVPNDVIIRGAHGEPGAGGVVTPPLTRHSTRLSAGSWPEPR